MIKRPHHPGSVVVIWFVASLAALAAYVPTNDHFHRISAGRQIARYGELPFRDYFDPGFFLTELSSAAVQRAFGDNLVGEIALNVASIATGATLVLLLSRRASGSWLIAAAAAAAALALRPRAYDYDKFLFYPLGLFLCWRVYDRDRVRDLAILAAAIVLAGGFRYDNGLFIAGAAVIGLAVVHPPTSLGFWQRAGMLVSFAGMLVMPFLWFISTHGGIADALDQVVTYAARESSRTPLFRLPSISLENGFDSGALAGVVAYVFVALPIIAGLPMLRAPARSGVADRERARRWCVIALCVLADLFILRDPIGARIGGMAGPPAVLAAFLAAPLSRRMGSVRLIAAVTCVAAAGVAAAGMRTDAWRRLEPSSALEALSSRAQSPIPLENLPPRTRGIVAYLRECTAPDQRVMLTWFAPEIHFFAQRGFAGGNVAVFGAQWSEPRFQRRMVQKLESEAVPLVIRHENPGELPFGTVYPVVEGYLRQHYDVAGETAFSDLEADGHQYRLLIHRAWRAWRRWEATSLPCGFVRSGAPRA